MEIKRLTDTNDPLYEKAMALYKISFHLSLTLILSTAIIASLKFSYHSRFRVL